MNLRHFIYIAFLGAFISPSLSNAAAAAEEDGHTPQQTPVATAAEQPPTLAELRGVQNLTSLQDEILNTFYHSVYMLKMALLIPKVTAEEVDMLFTLPVRRSGFPLLSDASLPQYERYVAERSMTVAKACLTHESVLLDSVNELTPGNNHQVILSTVSGFTLTHTLPEAIDAAAEHLSNLWCPGDEANQCFIPGHTMSYIQQQCSLLDPIYQRTLGHIIVAQADQQAKKHLIEYWAEGHISANQNAVAPVGPLG